jgi:diguanylate cyclase (GGDEF)-like protein
MLIGYFFIIRTDLRTDTITGLGNRYSFIEFIDRAGRGKPGRVYESAAMGIGNFREINAGLGRQEGDEVLKAMAALIKNAMDKGDFAARYSADEFIIAVKPDSGRDITGMVARIEEAAALYGQNAGKPYTIELNKVFDRHSAGSGVSANEFLARIDSQMSGTRNKHRRSGDK